MQYPQVNNIEDVQTELSTTLLAKPQPFFTQKQSSNPKDYTLRYENILETEVNRIRSELSGHIASVLSLCLTTDRNYLISSSADKSIRVWSMIEHKKLYKLEGVFGEQELTSIALYTDNKTLVIGSNDGLVLIWDIRIKKQLFALLGHTGQVKSVCISHPKKLIISGSDDKTCKVWELFTGTLCYTLEHSCEINSVAAKIDGKHALAGDCSGEIKAWNLTTGNSEFCIRAFQCAIKSLP